MSVRLKNIHILFFTEKSLNVQGEFTYDNYIVNKSDYSSV